MIGWLVSQSLMALNKPEPVSAQLSRIVATANGQGLAVETRVMVARPAAESDYFMVLRPEEPAIGYWSRGAKSDEVRIYQVRNGELRLGLRFRPRYLSTYHRLKFRTDRVDDIDGSGTEEVLGSFAPVAMEPFDPIPLVIRFDLQANRYRLQALIRQRPNVFMPPDPTPWERSVIATARERAVLHDSFNRHLKLVGYRTEAYLVVPRTPNRTQPLLLTSNLIRADSHADAGLHHMDTHRLFVNRRRPVSIRCSETTFTPRASRGEDWFRAALRRMHWEKDASCGVT